MCRTVCGISIYGGNLEGNQLGLRGEGSDFVILMTLGSGGMKTFSKNKDFKKMKQNNPP